MALTSDVLLKKPGGGATKWITLIVATTEVAGFS